MHISINPTANSEVRNLNWNCCPCQSKLCVAYDPAQGLIWFLIIQRCSPSPHNEDGKSLATQNKASAEVQDTDKRHTAVMSTCWGGQPFPLACYSADQGQAGDQIKVLVWGELGPGAREAAWGMCAHIRNPGEGQVGWHCCRTRSKRGAAPETGLRPRGS